ncbi:MAG TPA: FKBP-type peptidyl-prolyl cis-trans isomerase [Paludibacter sp.]|nr:FKBP-type peptidyl-prolyl cis-trans isomerase [Paludibacter sp.]
MKRTQIISLLILLFLIVLPACRENEWADWRLKNEQWLEKLKMDHKNDSTFHVTSTGLCYKVIDKGYMRQPNEYSYITVNYKGTLIDGHMFDSGSNAKFYLPENIQGWKEGIPKMKGGGTFIFYIPYKLGYDTISTKNGIPPYSTLIFEVDLISSEN